MVITLPVEALKGRECWVGFGQRSIAEEEVIAASHTPPWLPSGWGYRGRRLSRG